MLGVTARCRHDVEAPRVAQDTDRDVDSLGLAADGDDDLRRMLQLLGGFGLETYGGAAGPEGAPRLNVGMQDTKPVGRLILFQGAF